MNEEARAELLKWLRMRSAEEAATVEGAMPYESDGYRADGAEDAFAEVIAYVEAMS